MAKVFTVIVPLTAAGGLTPFYDLVPPPGEDWEVTEMTASVFSGAALTAVPEVNAGLMTAASLVPANIRLSGNTGAVENTRGWGGRTSIFINNACWLRLANADAAIVTVAVTVRLVRTYGPAGQSSVVSGIAILGGAVATPIIPPPGEDWLLTDVGSSVWVNASPGGLPNVVVALTEAGNLATVANAGAASRGWDKPFAIHMNNTSFATLTPAGAATIGWSAVVTRRYGPNGVSNVITRTRVAAAGTGIVVIQPPPTEEWMITDIGCNAAFTAAIPTVLVNIVDAAGNVTIAQISTATKGWYNEMAYLLNNTNWMVLTGAPANIIGVSGIRWRG